MWTQASPVSPAKKTCTHSQSGRVFLFVFFLCLICRFWSATKHNINWNDNSEMIAFAVVKWARRMEGLCSPESCAGTPREPLLWVCICQYTNAGEMTEGARRARAHSPMTGAVRSIEQPWLLTDCGRWAGLSKAATVTFNLPNAHACTHTHTHAHTHHQWNYNIFCSTPCMSDCYPVCWGPGLPQGESRVEPVTKPIYRSPETHTQRAAAAVPSHPATAQAGSCRARFNDFLPPSPLCI